MKIKLTLILVYFIVFSKGFSQVQLDSSFGNGGKVATAFPPNLTLGADSAIQTNGKILVCGQFYAGVITGLFDNFQNYYCAVSRYNTDGTLDNSFGVNGVAIINSRETTSGAMSITIQADQKIILTSQSHRSPFASSTFSILRLNENGSFDSSFVSNPFITTSSQINFGTIAVNIDGNGKILICGSTDTDFIIKRCNSNGSPDTTFGTNGTTYVNIDGNDFASDLAFQSDGKIIVVGQTNNVSISSYYKVAIARLNSNGILDTSFGTNGKASFDFEASVNYPKLLINSDDKLVIGATVSLGVQLQNRKIGLLKTDANGNLDLSFGINGRSILQNNLQSSFSDFKRQTDNKILLVGNVSNTDFFMSRFDVNGNLDTTFSTIGSISTDFNSNDDWARSINIQSDGKVVVAGISFSNNVPSSLAIARYVLGPLSTNSFVNSTFSVYPNPFSNNFTIDLPSDENQFVNIELLDINGRKILDILKNQKIEAGNNKLHVDVASSLPNGLYFLNISNDKNFKTIKIIK